MLRNVSSNVGCNVITCISENIYSVFHVAICIMKYVNKYKNPGLPLKFFQNKLRKIF